MRHIMVLNAKGGCGKSTIEMKARALRSPITIHSVRALTGLIVAPITARKSLALPPSKKGCGTHRATLISSLAMHPRDLTARS